MNKAITEVVFQWMENLKLKGSGWHHMDSMINLSIKKGEPTKHSKPLKPCNRKHIIPPMKYSFQNPEMQSN